MKKGIQLPENFKTDLKRKRLERLIDNATGHLIDLWLTVSAERLDGDLSGWDEMDIAIAAGWPLTNPIRGLIDALIQCGFLIHENGRYFLPDWNVQQTHIAGTSKRKIKATINALIKHHGRVEGLKIAISERKIDVTRHGYEVPYGFKAHIENMREKEKENIEKIKCYAGSTIAAQEKCADSMDAARQIPAAETGHAKTKKRNKKGSLVRKIAGKK